MLRTPAKLSAARRCINSATPESHSSIPEANLLGEHRQEIPTTSTSLRDNARILNLMSRESVTSTDNSGKGDATDTPPVVTAGSVSVYIGKTLPEFGLDVREQGEAASQSFFVPVGLIAAQTINTGTGEHGAGHRLATKVHRHCRLAVLAGLHIDTLVLADTVTLFHQCGE